MSPKQLGYYFLQEALVSLKLLFGFFPPRIYFTSWMIRILSQVLFFTLVVTYWGGREKGLYVLLGNSILTIASRALGSGAGVYANEKWMGTLPLILAAPHHSLCFLLGRNFPYMVDGVLGAIMVFIPISLLFGMGVREVLLFLTTLPILLIISFSMAGMGALLAALTFNQRTSAYATSIAWYILAIMTGVNFPTSDLPSFWQSVSHFIPLTHGLQAIRAIISSSASSIDFIVPLIFKEILIGTLYLIIGFVMLSWFIRQGKEEGGVEWY